MPAKIKKNCLPSPLSFMDKVALLEKRQGRKIIRFDLAEPQFLPPPEAIDGTIFAIKQGKYRYSSSWGLSELISEVRKYLFDTRDLMYDDGEVFITTGGKFANYAFFSSLFKKRDGIVLLKPFWTSFGAVPEMLGLKRIDVWSDEPYHLNCDRLLTAMTQRPKAIVINTPHNPTGGMLNEADLKLLRDLAIDYDLLILSDEIDWAYAYDGRKHVSPASVSGIEERTVVTDGFSKVFSMTGWRVGFAAGPKELIAKMHHVQEHSISSPTTFAQYGCVEALKSRREYIPEVVKKCDANRHSVFNALRRIEALECSLPEGGFYVYPRILPRYPMDSSAFCEDLLEGVGVSVIPGSLFGDDRSTFRLCYAVEEDLLNEGLSRMENFFIKRNASIKNKKRKK
jgi:aspartate aminotransferase